MALRSSEKKGIIVLCILLTGLFMLPPLFEKSENPFFLLTQAEIPDTNLSSYALPKVKKQRIELNTTDSAALTKIRGIGPYYASKIIKYRERLGGFHSPLQLKEIPLKYLLVDTIMDYFHADIQYIRKKEMDTMSFKAILHHPYLEYEDVQLIFKAKKEWGKINYSILEEKKVLAPYKLKKIKPYFK